MNNRYPRVEYKESGDKRTVKITPPRLSWLFSIRGKPDQKGKQNPHHYHVTPPKGWRKER